ncbi:flagellar basal body-associated protein FliL [Caloramator mitchellensis]|uniref:Flagellar protein FliL n=1 Tax=Caloramator mitchellensis TaxID=908809 RepID=A0A0R3JU83_CALMK|nr:flagellar basal body-associated FliL family protein [Caloramator mitchellensis]KRQ87048.1 flagellar basal body-associated protein FliL [Caloramator mitchellensis]
MAENKGASKLLIIIIVLLVLVLIAGGFVGYMLLVKNKQSTTKVLPEKTMAMDELVVNLNDEGMRTYIKVKIFLAYTNSKLEGEITEKMPQIRDVVITTVRSKKSEEFEGNKVEAIRKEIRDNVNNLLTKDKITNVYFYDLLIQ